VSTVVDAPATVRAVADVPFRSVAVNIVQPNLSSSGTVRVNIHLPADVSEPQRVTDDPCCSVSESVVAHSSPGPVVVQFQTPFAWTSARNQCNRVVSQARDDLFLVARTVSHSPSVVCALGNASFRAIASNCGQPNRATTVTVSVARGFSDVPESEHVADDSRRCVTESFFAHRTPDAVVEHLKSSFSWIAASVQSHFDLGTCDDQTRNTKTKYIKIKLYYHSKK